MSQAKGEGADFSFTKIAETGMFDAHIAREIHGYPILDRQVVSFADAFMEDGTTVYDIGASTGRLINKLAQSLDGGSSDRTVQFVGYEPLASFTDSFTPFNDSVTMRTEAVGGSTTFENASLVTSIFTLQFMPMHLRPAILAQIHKGLHANGSFIWAEKVVASDSRIESLINAYHLQLKREGSDDTDILDKDLRLRGQMRPITLEENIGMLQEAGFTRYEVFWRVNNFVGILAVKSGGASHD